VNRISVRRALLLLVLVLAIAVGVMGEGSHIFPELYNQTFIEEGLSSLCYPDSVKVFV